MWMIATALIRITGVTSRLVVRKAISTWREFNEDMSNLRNTVFLLSAMSRIKGFDICLVCGDKECMVGFSEEMRTEVIRKIEEQEIAWDRIGSLA